jgi:choline dehydrogenase
MAKLRIGLRWLLAKDGLGATNHFEVGGFIRSRAGIRYPDLQFHFLSLAISYDGTRQVRRHGFQAHVGSMRSKSRGWIRLRSADSRDRPAILFNYMSDPDDWADMRACVRLAREIFAQDAFAPIAARNCRLGPMSWTTRRSTRSCDAVSRAPTIPAAPVGWVIPPIR